jgi:hypothetical protein
MNQYTAKHIEDFFNQYEQYISHVIVAHTQHRPYASHKKINSVGKDKAIRQIQSKLEQTKKDLRHALNCFNKLLYPSSPNRPRQNPMLFRPLTFVTIEGTDATLDRSKTIHVNIAIGNLPAVLNVQDVETLFRHVWHQSRDVKAYNYRRVNGESRWMGYSLKEAQQAPHKAWDTNSIWDVGNCWIPHAALKAD